MMRPARDFFRWGAQRRMLVAIMAMLVLGLLSGHWIFFGSSLEITPENFSECNGGNTVVHVTWEVGRRYSRPISIYVNNLGSTPQLWYTGDSKGVQDTGEWMRDGTSLILMDAKGREITKRTLESTDCPGAPVASATAPRPASAD
ncbi:hypothetical protein [Rhodanobacter sp. L36]|uniref:hypothetical protein n=1 Tax=Rhodanobacter sp. L36 TaxID=1747221 RepID=UPI00131DD2AF|nr:hypothetical protein [Rhodanobacter sp. L36]